MIVHSEIPVRSPSTEPHPAHRPNPIGGELCHGLHCSGVDTIWIPMHPAWLYWTPDVVRETEHGPEYGVDR